MKQKTTSTSTAAAALRPDDMSESSKAELSGGKQSSPLLESIEELEERTERLVALCGRLREENEALRKGHRKVLQDANHRNDRDRLARSRLESVVTRLHDLESRQ